MNERLFLVDAFTGAPFAGNPAAVCLLDRERDAAWMQAVAAEMNQSETAFLHRPGGDGDWVLRWFTPAVEVDLCGHATLAAAHVLWRECGLDDGVLHFRTRGGRLSAERDGAAIALDFPADPPAPIDPPAALAAALRTGPRWVGRGRVGWLVHVDDAERVRRLQPDMARLAALDAALVMVTAAGDGPDHDFVSRVFAPRVGIPEDPVTGAAHCCLGPVNTIRTAATGPIGREPRRAERSVLNVHKRGATPARGLWAPSLRVAPQKLPGRVARRSFGITKLLSSRLAWQLLGQQRRGANSVNRP